MFCYAIIKLAPWVVRESGTPRWQCLAVWSSFESSLVLKQS